MEYLLPMSRGVGPGWGRAFESGGPDYLSATHDVGSETDFSMSAWIKISSQTNTVRVISGMWNSAANDTGAFEMMLTTGGVLRARIETDGGVGSQNDYGSTDLRDGVWHLVACKWDGSIMTCWVDNGAADVADVTDRAFPAIDKIGIGARVDLVPDAGFEGHIDEVSFWEGHLLTDAEVLSLHASGNNSAVQYLPAINASTTTLPTHHYAMSAVLHPTSVGEDDVRSLDLTDNGTEDVAGIPAGEGAVFGTLLASRFDGTNYLRKAVNDYLIADSSGSITAWFKTSLTTGVQTIFYTGDEGTTNDFVWLAVDTGTVTLFTNDSGVANTVATDAATFDDGEWHFVEARSSGTAWTIRVDGVNQAITADDGLNNGDWFADIPNRNNVVIGAAVFGTTIPADTSSWFVGDVDNVMVFSSPLTDDEADWMHTNAASYTLLGSSGDANNPGVANVGGSWSFNELTGDMTDDTGSNDLVRTGFPIGITFTAASLEWAGINNPVINNDVVSMTCSFKSASVGDFHGLMAVGASDVERKALYINSSNQVAAICAGSAASAEKTTTATISNATWHFCGLIVASNASRIACLDSEVAAAETTAITKGAAYTNTALSSSRADAALFPANGTLDNAAFWSIARSADQYNWLRTAGAGGGPVSHEDVQRITHANNPGFANIAAWYQLNERAGTTLVNVHNPGTSDMATANSPTLAVTGKVSDVPVTVDRT